jgi:hypothetical protein
LSAAPGWLGRGGGGVGSARRGESGRLRRGGRKGREVLEGQVRDWEGHVEE